MNSKGKASCFLVPIRNPMQKAWLQIMQVERRNMENKIQDVWGFYYFFLNKHQAIL